MANESELREIDAQLLARNCGDRLLPGNGFQGDRSTAISRWRDLRRELSRVDRQYREQRMFDFSQRTRGQGSLLSRLVSWSGGDSAAVLSVIPGDWRQRLDGMGCQVGARACS